MSKNNRIAFVASVYNEVDKIKKQLQQKKVKNVDVFEYGAEPDGYDIIIDNVRPNKEYGEILDLGQCLNLHGFPEDPYTPPEYTGHDLIDKKSLEYAMSGRRMSKLSAVINDDTPEEISKEKYKDRIHQIVETKKKLTEMTIRELSNKLEIETSPSTLIAIGAVLFDKIHCSDDFTDNWGRPARGYHAKNGKDVINFLNPDSIAWMSELWVEILPKEEDYYQQKYTKALRTRLKNMLKEKASIWGIRFFIEFLMKEDELEKQLPELSKEDNEDQSGYTIHTNDGYEIVIEDDDIPF